MARIIRILRKCLLKLEQRGKVHCEQVYGAYTTKLVDKIERQSIV